MMSYLPTSKRGLWIAFFVFLLLNLGFLAVMAVFDFTIIDEMWRPADVIAHVEAFSPTQRRAHLWMTATLDVAYPLSYAALFGGLARRAFPQRLWLCWPVLSCALADLVEGLSQIMILSGHHNWAALKMVATPIKLALFITAIAIAVAALWRLWRRRRHQATPL